MSVLNEVKQWSLKNLVDEDTKAILLVGSWARGMGSDEHDIDLIIVKQHQLSAISHQEIKRDSFTLDIWIHDKEALRGELFHDLEDLNQINNTSMILSFLDGAEIWYEEEPFLDEFKQKTKNWSWDKKYSKYLNFSSERPNEDFLAKAFDENLELLRAAKNRLAEGKPVSHRRKDYPELSKETEESKAKNVLDLTLRAYEHLGIERHWSEFEDGKKAIRTGKWQDALASLKDVLRFMIRYELPSVPEQLLDPSIWKSASEMTISDELKSALKAAYS